MRPFNLTGDLARLPFGDAAYDIVLEACLCQVPRTRLGAVASELRRVTRRGIFLGSVATDLALDLIERYTLLAGVETLMSRWEWSELLAAQGFNPTLIDPARLERAWQRAHAANTGLEQWCEDAEALLYCFYDIAGQAAEASPSKSAELLSAVF